MTRPVTKNDYLYENFNLCRCTYLNCHCTIQYSSGRIRVFYKVFDFVQKTYATAETCRQQSLIATLTLCKFLVVHWTQTMLITRATIAKNVVYFFVRILTIRNSHATHVGWYIGQLRSRTVFPQRLKSTFFKKKNHLKIFKAFNVLHIHIHTY